MAAMTTHSPNFQSIPEIADALTELKAISKEKEPVKWAEAQKTVATAYLYQAEAAPGLSEFADKGIEHTKKALEVFTESFDAFEYASGVNNLAPMYLNRLEGNRADNVAEALKCVKTALKIFKNFSGPTPIPVAPMLPRFHTLIAELYGSNELNIGTPAGNKDLAIRHRLAELTHYPKTEMPTEWAKCQLDIGVAYQARINGTKQDNATVAIKHWEKALEVYTEASAPELWTEIQSVIKNANQ